MKVPVRGMAQSKRVFMITMLGPAIIVLFMLTIFPFVYSVYMSINKFYMANPNSARFIGLGHYIEIFLGDPVFWASLKRTIIYAATAVSCELLLGMLVASSLEGISRGKGFFRTIFLLPMAATPIAIAFAWRIMYNPTLGIINYFLKILNMDAVEWISDPSLALISLILVDIWQWTPFMVLMLLAGLMSLPEAPFEAAKVDGASGWQIFTRLTLPLMEPIILIALVFRLIDAFKVFDTIFVMTGGGPGEATQTLNVYTFLTGFSYLRIGYAAALAIIMLIIVIVVCQLLLRRSRLMVEEGAETR